MVKKQILKFYAPWCNMCTNIAPVFANIRLGDVEKIEINIEEEENMNLVKTFDVQYLPTFVFINDNTIVDKVVGADPQGLTEKSVNLLRL